MTANHSERSSAVIPSASDEETAALVVRSLWMKEMGLSEEEIQEHCRPDLGPFKLQEELENLQAGRELAPFLKD